MEHEILDDERDFDKKNNSFVKTIFFSIIFNLIYLLSSLVLYVLLPLESADVLGIDIKDFGIASYFLLGIFLNSYIFAPILKRKKSNYSDVIISLIVSFPFVLSYIFLYLPDLLLYEFNFYDFFEESIIPSIILGIMIFIYSLNLIKTRKENKTIFSIILVIIFFFLLNYIYS